MSSSEDDGSDVFMSAESDFYDSDLSEDDDSAAVTGRPVERGPGPWFSVVEPSSFEIATLPDFIFDHGPIGFPANLTAFDYFEKFLTDGDEHIFDIIVEETNRYAETTLNRNNPATKHARGNSWTPVTKEELSAFFGIYLSMGIVRKPSFASYWQGSDDIDNLMETPNFSHIMSRNRFQAILRFLHCNDNSTAVERGQPGYDPLHKVSNIVEFFNRTFDLNYRLVLVQ